MDSHFIKLLVCPLCNSPLRHDQSRQELICQYDKLAFPIKNGIPVMLSQEARSLSADADTPVNGLPAAGAENHPTQPDTRPAANSPAGPGSSDGKH